jgi:hypothetical protein
VYDLLDQAQRVIDELESSGYPTKQISLVTRNVTEQVPHEETLQLGDNTERNAVKGAGFGGLFGLLLGAPLLAIPGVGPVLLAGPLAVGMTGAIVGGFLGSMSGWGVHSDRVEEYEELVRGGSVLVVAHGTPRQVAEAKRTFDHSDAKDVHLHARASDETPEVDDRPPVDVE